MKLLVIADNDDFTWYGGTYEVDAIISCDDIFDPLILQAAAACQCGAVLTVKAARTHPARSQHRSRVVCQLRDLRNAVIVIDRQIIAQLYSKSFKRSIVMK